MKDTSAQLREFAVRLIDFGAFVALGCAAIVLGGCAVQKKPAIPWRTAVLVRPLAPQKPASADEPAEIPDLRLEIPPPDPIFVPRTSPARPRTFAPPPNREAQTERPQMPLIVPELSAQESGQLQQETQQYLSDAERNLSAASRKALNAAQTDLASKVRGFIADAREAGKVGDWSRARDLAKKAQVLSEELANSL